MEVTKRTRSHLTAAHQRYARSKVSRKSLSRAGARGAAVTRARYGDDFLFTCWRRWKLGKPSKNELLVIGLLARLNLLDERDYERDSRLASSLMSLDFFFWSKMKAIEVHGRIHGQFEKNKRRKRDARKRALCREQGIAILWVKERDLKNVPKLFQKIQNFLEQ